MLPCSRENGRESVRCGAVRCGAVLAGAVNIVTPSPLSACSFCGNSSKIMKELPPFLPSKPQCAHGDFVAGSGDLPSRSPPLAPSRRD